MKALIAATVLTFLVTSGNAFAAHELAQPPANQEPADTHISWHEFRHDLGAYPSVIASMDKNGIVTLSGHTDSAYEKAQLNRLASRVTGASEVKNLILTD